MEGRDHHPDTSNLEDPPPPSRTGPPGYLPMRNNYSRQTTKRLCEVLQRDATARGLLLRGCGRKGRTLANDTLGPQGKRAGQAIGDVIGRSILSQKEHVLSRCKNRNGDTTIFLDNQRLAASGAQDD